MKHRMGSLQRWGIAAGLLLLALLTGCGQINDALDPRGGNGSAVQTASEAGGMERTFELSSSTVDALFASAGEYAQQNGDSTTITVVCQFSEGTFCWYDQQADLDDPNATDRDLARRVIDEIGPQVVERAPNNTVMLQCTRAADGSRACQIKRFENWEQVAVQ
jgi:hypothetical protein